MSEENIEPAKHLVVPEGSSMADIERQAIFWTLEQTDGNRTKAAWRLGISVRTLRNKLKQYKDVEAA